MGVQDVLDQVIAVLSVGLCFVVIRQEWLNRRLLRAQALASGFKPVQGVLEWRPQTGARWVLDGSYLVITGLPWRDYGIRARIGPVGRAHKYQSYVGRTVEMSYRSFDAGFRCTGDEQALKARLTEQVMDRMLAGARHLNVRFFQLRPGEIIFMIQGFDPMKAQLTYIQELIDTFSQGSTPTEAPEEVQAVSSVR